jgi:hypothetical protein
MILGDDNFRFILLIRFADNDARFYNSAEADFNDEFSFRNGAANLTVIWRFDGDR